MTSTHITPRGPPALFLQFTDLYGQPVYVRPERVDAVKGIKVVRKIVDTDVDVVRPRVDYEEGSLIVLTNRETFRVRGAAWETADRLRPCRASSLPSDDVDVARA